MRVTPDAGILVRANKKFTGPARLLLDLLRTSSHSLILSPYILEEVERVLNYPRTQGVFKLQGTEIAEFTVEIQC